MNNFLGIQIQNKVQRQYYLNIFLSLVPEFFFSLIFCFFWNESEKVLSFLLCFITFQMLYLILWAKDSIWQWVFFSINGRKIIARSIYNYFKNNNFPEPEEIIESSLNYIENIVDNDQIPINTRLRACYILALKNSLQETNQFQQLFRISLAMEDAIELYKTDFKNN